MKAKTLAIKCFLGQSFLEKIHYTFIFLKVITTYARSFVNLVLDTAQETVQAFAGTWKTIKDLPLKKEIRKAISKHLKNIPF